MNQSNNITQVTFHKADRILVIGGTGFIGTHLVRRCLRDAGNITCLGFSRSGAHADNGRVMNILTDMRDREAMKSVLQGKQFEYVFNLAGYIDHTPFSKGGRSVIETQFVGLMNLLENLDRSTLRKFVQIGSSDEYGGNPAPQQETMRENPIAPYSAGKAAATHFIQMLSATEGFPGTVLRLFLVYGPGQDDKRFLPQIIKACLRNEEFKTSEGKQLRDFCYVDDVVEGLVAAALSASAAGEVINLASGAPVTIRKMVETVMRLTGKGRPQWGAYPYRKGENMELYADISKAGSKLGWTPRTTLEAGLQLTIDHYRNIL